MEAKIDKGNLIITLSLEEPRLSSSGKNLLVATSRGVQRSTVRVRGRVVSVVANAFIKPDDAAKNKDSKIRRKKRREA